MFELLKQRRHQVIGEPTLVPLQGSPMRIALAPDGRVCILALGRDKTTPGSLEDRTYQLMMLDRDGQSICDRAMEVPLDWDFRLDGAGLAWVGYRNRLIAFDSQGEQINTIMLNGGEVDEIGAFLVADDAFYVASGHMKASIKYRDERGRPLRGPRPTADGPRVARFDPDGHVRWSTQIPMDPGDPEPWIQLLGGEALLFGDGLLLAMYTKYVSGLSSRFCFDAETGELLWSTPHEPFDTTVIAGPGQFLICVQGYGEFRSYLIDRDGVMIDGWLTSGPVVLSGEGQIYAVEATNDPSVKQHLVHLEPGGHVRRGPRVPGYRMSYPLICEDDTIVFWRDGRLYFADNALDLYVAYEPEEALGSFLHSRTLLDNRGRLYITFNSVLLMVDTDLPPLADSAWPCGDGNLAGNPVWNSGRV